MRADRFDLPLRILVQDPLPDLTLVLQKGATGKAEHLPPAPSSVPTQALAFDLEVTVTGALPDGRPRFLGAYVQGPPTGRFVYICVGKMAGQADSEFGGRMKIPLGALDWPLIEAAQPGGRIEGRVPGRNAKGGPALATVPILPPGWAAQARA
ncbi:MAG TPA: DUF5990 family protein [Caulobacteraceae bacterium]|jgi:hypothetical protein